MRTILMVACLSSVVTHAVPLPVAEEEAPLEDTGQRFRWGLSAGAGSSVGRGGVALLAELRLGYQLSRSFGVFGTMRAGGSMGEVSGGLLDFGAVAEFTLVDWFYFGGGLAASYGATSFLLQSAPSFASVSETNGASFRPVLDLRFGFSTGASRPPLFNRGGFNVGVHALVMLHPNLTISRIDSNGNFSSSAYPLQVSFTPMLTLGLDFR